MNRLCLSLLFTFLCSVGAYAQIAEVGGAVEDPSGAFVPKASVVFRNRDTGVQLRAATNASGQYRIASIDPGRYDATVQVAGFKGLKRENIKLEVGATAQIDFRMELGDDSETVTVTGSGEEVNTTDGTVSTVIDRQFVENIPMNGRSFQTLIELSPGVVTNTPQGTNTNTSNSGEFSVNGIRTTSNNSTVDGASANNSPYNVSGGGSAGMVASETVLGTTQSLIPVDGMEEFRVSTSTYSAQYGRQPGAQVSLRSRSGTNQYHGTLFDFLRNVDLDANNWFNTYASPVIATPVERQNDFGGTFGGPVTIPHFYSGKDRAFFFFTYEGLRMSQTAAASIQYVPSNGTYNTATYTNPEYANVRKYAPAALQPLLNSMALPNCSIVQDAQCLDYGNGGSPYLSSATSVNPLNSINGRFDYQVSPTMRVFARYNDTPNHYFKTAGSWDQAIYRRNQVFLLGVDSTIHGSMTNELRLQYAPSYYHLWGTPSNIGGGEPIDLYAAEGISPAGETEIIFDLPTETIQVAETYGSRQFQPQITESLAWAHGTHLFKAGLDYRQTTSYFGDGDFSRGPNPTYHFTSASSMLNNTSSTTSSNFLRTDPTYKSLGLFVQDEWRVHPRLSLSLGLRWELNPAPSVSGAQLYTYTGDPTNPSTLGLSAKGAPLYKTTYTDFGPRFGAAIVLVNRPGHELALRGGGGLYYELIGLTNTFGGGFMLGAQSTASYSGSAGGFPLTRDEVVVPITDPVLPSPTAINISYYPKNNIFPPSAVQWNVSAEQELGAGQSVTVGYVASAGLNLSTYYRYKESGLNLNFGTFSLFGNGPGSSYNSLQAKYQLQLHRGFQALASYTWAHSIDSEGSDATLGSYPLQRGNSDNDVRHQANGALVYNLPSSYSNRWERQILGNWNVDLIFVARTSFPFTVSGPAYTDPITAQIMNERVNYNGKFPYIHVPSIPGGKEVDPTVFSVPADGSLTAGDGPRNFLRGFGENQANVAIQRFFTVYERLKLQLRAEAFNVANHPNFGNVSNTCGSSTAGAACNNTIMGQATATLNSSLGGLSSLYQQGGPRSLEFALKLQF